MVFESPCTTSKENIPPFQILLLYLQIYSFINSQNAYEESNFCAMTLYQELMNKHGPHSLGIHDTTGKTDNTNNYNSSQKCNHRKEYYRPQEHEEHFELDLGTQGSRHLSGSCSFAIVFMNGLQNPNDCKVPEDTTIYIFLLLS